MNLEERIRAARLVADAGPLRASVLRSAQGAVREQRLWRWTWAAAALVLAIVIPVNLLLKQEVSPAAMRPVSEARRVLAKDLGGIPQPRLDLVWTSHFIPRSVKEIR